MKIIFDSEEQKKDFKNKTCPHDFGYERQKCSDANENCEKCLEKFIRMEVEEGEVNCKDGLAVTCNGRPAFYAAMYEDIRKCAIECGWAVALHGSLASDMDIMAMPWTERATTFETFVSKIVSLFGGNTMAEQYSISYNEKPHGRKVATIPIWGDFYLDISTMKRA